MKSSNRRPKGVQVVPTLAAAVIAAGIGPALRAQQSQIPSTVQDFFEPGTQESTLNDYLTGPNSCRPCHEFDFDGNDNEVVPPWDNWITSVMAHASRDPIWHAAWPSPIRMRHSAAMRAFAVTRQMPG